MYTFKVSRGNADIIRGSRMVKFSKAPVNKSQLPLFMVNHDIVRLDIPASILEI